jgi:hypothetical protein
LLSPGVFPLSGLLIAATVAVDLLVVVNVPVLRRVFA